jgi:hypothetical protein
MKYALALATSLLFLAPATARADQVVIVRHHPRVVIVERPRPREVVIVEPCRPRIRVIRHVRFCR